MNNKRVIFYLISLIVLMSLFVVYVWAVAPVGAILDAVVTQITVNGTALKLNITTGANLNVSCNGSVFLRDGADAGLGNISLYHNLNTSANILTLNASNTTNNTFHMITGFNTTTIAATFDLLRGGAINFTPDGAVSRANSTINEGNYTVACLASLNTTNASFTLAHLRNFSANITLTIDRSQPNFSLINVSDGTNIVQLNALNGTVTGQTNAWLRNSTDLTIRVSVTEPNADKVMLYWITNGSALPALNLPIRQITPLRNLSLLRLVQPSGSSNVTVYNGSFAFSGDALQNVSADFTDGASFTFFLIANDSATNVKNFTNNNRGFNFTLDGKAPQFVTFEVDKSRVEIGQAAKVTCTGNDTSPISYVITLTKPSGSKVEKNPLDGIVTFRGTETGEAGKSTVSCKIIDQVKYESEKTLEFTTYYGDLESESDEGADEEERKVAEVDLSIREGGAIPEGKVTAMKGESTTFTLDGTTAHTLTVLDVTDQEAILKFESTPVEISFKVGETKEVDLDGDGQADIIAILNAISDGEVDVTIKAIEKALPPTTQTDTTTETTDGEPLVEQGKPSKTGLIVLVLVILAVIVAAFFLLKGKKGKKGEIKFTSKDLSSDYNF